MSLVWIDSPYSVVSLGLERALKDQARVHVGREAPKEVPSSVIVCVENGEGIASSVRRAREISSEALVLVFGMQVDLQLARDALREGARGFIHAGMSPDQVARAVKVAAGGELVAPRELLQYLIAQDDPVDLNILSVRQQEIMGFVVEGMSNAQIAERLYLSESTVKQHLRAAYKTLGVKNRAEAARLVRTAG